MISEGSQHIQNLLYTLVEGIALGMYTSLEDAQQDAKEYLAMDKAVKKLEKWDPKKDKVEDLSKIFEGISRSMKIKEEQEEMDKAVRVEEYPDIRKDMEAAMRIFGEYKTC